MENILKSSLKFFKDSGGSKFSSISGKKIRDIFKIIDNTYFDGWIMQVLKDDIHFYAVDRKTPPASMVGVEKGNEYYIDVAPNVLSIYGKDILKYLILSLQESAINICMVLLKFMRPDKGPEYGPNGSLFVCAYKEFFKGRPLSLSDVSSTNKWFGYSNWQNSCYLDSVLMIILSNDTWMEKVRESPSSEIRTAMLKDHNQIFKEETPIVSKKCVKIRSLLSSITPGIRVGSSWVMFNSGEIYSSITDLFPDMKMNVPVLIRRKIQSFSDFSLKKKIEKISTFTMWDFMEPKSSENLSKEILWNELRDPGIVFINGGAPRIKDFKNTGREAGYINLGSYKIDYDVVKERSFSEIILGKYMLVGVVVLKGVDENGEGGSHYTCYFKRNYRWYYYDDMNPEVYEVERLPETGIWKEEYGNMPSMYFYELLDLVPLEYDGENISYKTISTSSQGAEQILAVANTEEGLEIILSLDPTSRIVENKYYWRISPEKAVRIRSQLYQNA